METIENPFSILKADLTEIKLILLDLKNENLSTKKRVIKETGGVSLAEEVLNLKRPTIYALVAAKKLPCSKKGKKLYFYRSELEAWIKSGRRKTVSEIADEVNDFSVNHTKK